MRTDVPTQKKLHDKLYTYSERYIPYKLLTRLGFKNISQARVTDFIVSYGFAISMAIVALLFSYVLNRYLDHTPFYVFYLLAIIMSVWVGGRRAGFLNLALTTLSSFFLFMNFYSRTTNPNMIYVYMAIYVGGGVLIIYIFDLVRESETLEKYKRREQLYSQSFLKLHDEYTKALEEIRARDEFLSIASHELKTPLTTMLLKLNHMLHTVRNVSLAKFSVPELMKVLENAQVQIKWLAAMINDLLNVSLITTGRLDLETQEVDLVKLSQQIIENFREVAQEEGYDIRFIAKMPVVGRWDNARVEQAVTNLLSNAIKYGRGKPIDITVTNSGQMGKFIIRDRGIGIPRHEQKMMFERFKRAVPTTEKKKGLGVGLYITKQIVKAHNGKITVSSFPQPGTTFTMELPLNRK